jgi:hypothetical protein
MPHDSRATSKARTGREWSQQRRSERTASCAVDWSVQRLEVGIWAACRNQGSGQRRTQMIPRNQRIKDGSIPVRGDIESVAAARVAVGEGAAWVMPGHHLACRPADMRVCVKAVQAAARDRRSRQRRYEMSGCGRGAFRKIVVVFVVVADVWGVRSDRQLAWR